MLLSSRGRDFAQNFEPDLSRGVPPPLSQLFNILKIHQKSGKSYFFTKKLPLQGNADTELISLGPKVQFSGIILPLQGNADTELISLFPKMIVFESELSNLGFETTNMARISPGIQWNASRRPNPPKMDEQQSQIRWRGALKGRLH